MASDLFRQFNPQNQQNLANNGNGLPNLINKFNEFQSMFRGDPRQMVQQLLQSGRMTQTQYNQLSQMATQFQNLLRKG